MTSSFSWQNSISLYWKTQQWPQDWKRSLFIPIPNKDNAKECSNYRTVALISHASKVVLKILQARGLGGQFGGFGLWPSHAAGGVNPGPRGRQQCPES